MLDLKGKISMSWTLHITNIADIVNQNNGKLHYSVKEAFSTRFANDKAFVDTERYVVVFDGYLLNKNELQEMYKAVTVADILTVAYENKGAALLNELRGSYNGFLCDKVNSKWIIFVSHCGDRPLFYHEGENSLTISSDLNDVSACLKNSGKKYKANLRASYYLLTYGYMVDNSTHIEDIYRLMPGDYVLIHEHRIKLKSYFRFSNLNVKKISVSDAVEEVDNEFRKATKRIFNKDLEYGFKAHLADMSGGLDSRMASWVARDMGYENITNICYAQSHSIEWKAALKTANALGNDFMFMPLDKCNFLFDIDELVRLNYGLAIYAGITGGKNFLSNLNNSVFGLEITGQLGDVVIGTFVKGKPFHKQPQFNENRYSNRLDYVFDEKILSNYENNEMFAFYSRGLLGALSTHIIRNNYTDVASPFLDVDFLSFCLGLPLEYRIGHKLYSAWIRRKYPCAAQLYTTRFAGPVPENAKLGILRRKIRNGLIHYPGQLLRKLGFSTNGSPKSMNPMDYWYMTDRKVQEFIHAYYRENIKRILSGSKLSVDVENMFQNGTAMEKLLVLTLLATYKLYDFTEVG